MTQMTQKEYLNRRKLQSRTHPNTMTTQKEYFNRRKGQSKTQPNSISRLSELTGKQESLLNKIYDEHLAKFGNEATAYGALYMWLNRRGL